MLLQIIHYFYLHQHNATIPIVVYPIAILADRPECCILNSWVLQAIQPSGSYNPRWQTLKTIASCNMCFDKHVKMYFDENLSRHDTKPKCGRCCDFEFMINSKIYQFKTPPNCPTTKPIMSPPLSEGWNVIISKWQQTLRPIKLTYQSLVIGMRAACFNLHSKQWKVIETRSYLKQIKVSTAMADHLI